MPGTPLDGLRTALSATRQVVAGVQQDQWELPTPCTEWSVADLTAHLVLGNAMFAAILRGESQPGSSSGRLDRDRLEAYDAAAEELVAAFSSPGALERIVTVPFGTVPGAVALHLRVTELLVHGWDLAQATGQRLDVPAAVAEQELTFSEGALGQLPPGRSPFGPPQPAPAEAGPLERLVALLGRTP